MENYSKFSRRLDSTNKDYTSTQILREIKQCRNSDSTQDQINFSFNSSAMDNVIQKSGSTENITPLKALQSVKTISQQLVKRKRDQNSVQVPSSKSSINQSKRRNRQEREQQRYQIVDKENIKVNYAQENKKNEEI